MAKKRNIKLDKLIEKKEKKILHYHQCNIGNHGWNCNENHIYAKLGRIKDLYCNISPCDECVDKIVKLLEQNNFFLNP